MAEEPKIERETKELDQGANLDAAFLSKEDLDSNQILDADISTQHKKIENSFAKIGSRSFREYFLQEIDKLTIGQDLSVIQGMVTILDTITEARDFGAQKDRKSNEPKFFQQVDKQIQSLLKSEYLQVRSLAADLYAASKLTQVQVLLTQTSELQQKSEILAFRTRISKGIKTLESLLGISELSRLRQMEIRQKINRLKRLHESIVKNGIFESLIHEILFDDEDSNESSSEESQVQKDNFLLVSRKNDKVFTRKIGEN